MEFVSFLNLFDQYVRHGDFIIVDVEKTDNNTTTCKALKVIVTPALRFEIAIS